MVAHNDRLPVTPASAPADRIVNADNGIAYLVQATGIFWSRAIADALTICMEFPPPVTVMVTIKSKVESASQVKPGIGHNFDRDWAAGTIGHFA